MTDIIIDDDLIDVTRPSTSGSNSSITTARRPMFLETEMRTDTITKRRVASTSTTASRSVFDVLENTKSPTDGLPPTTYTYAHSISYMPVTQNGPYGVPVMARRDLHGEHHSYTSTSYSSNSSAFASPTRFISTVRSQLANGYSAIRNRLNYHQQQEEQQPIPLLNSPAIHTATRTSSTSRTTTGYNLRQRPPIHSTPRDVEHDELVLTTNKQQTETKTIDDNMEDEQIILANHEEQHDYIVFQLFKRIVRAPFDLVSLIWHKSFALPWWLAILVLLLLGLYAFPRFGCKPFEHYPQSKIYQQCRLFQQYSRDVTSRNAVYLRAHTYDRGVRSFQQVYGSAVDVKDSVVDSLEDFYYNLKNSARRSFRNVKSRMSTTIGSGTDNAKEYCDVGLKKMNALIDEVKREREKFLGHRHALKPDQEQELQILIRQLLDEYAADETGQADYALEANGAKVVDTRCTEYADEPRQNVVKFLGIPIVHMSKQPDIMIKAGRLPGQCFPFKGDQGSVVIKLAVPVKPTEFVLEHLSKSISIVGHINSAPNNFTVYALKDKLDKDGRVLGRYFYDAEHGPSLQRFKPQLVNVPVTEYIEIRVSSNWGNPNYTCVYRFRVHGDLQTVQPTAPPAA